MRRESVEPSEHTLASLLTACATLDALHQGKWIHGYGIKVGVNMNSFVSTALLDMYVKCGDVTDARDVFDELYDVDIISWTAMIVGYTQTGRPLEALRIFGDKNFAGIIPNSITVASVLSASAQIRNLNFGRSIHVLGIKLGVENSPVVVNSLVDMYAKCRALSDANRIFKGSQNKDVITWNSMITGCAQNDLGHEALSLFNQMRLLGCSPDAVTLVSALSASASLGALQVGSSFHGYALKCAFLFNIYVNTALLNLYNKCGDLVSSRQVFDEMSDRNAVTWCAMVGGYGMQGDSASSINLFKEMLNEDFQPNDITFTSILSTCSHTGMVTEGQKYFNTMMKNHKVAPSTKHYACMVDMLSRAGKLAEALEFIEKMPCKANVQMWGAFLHGCTLYSNFDLGEVAVSRIMELRPESSDYYVLMFNLYASNARWAEATKIRDLMKERGMVKVPGFSSVGTENGLKNSVLLEHISQKQVHDRNSTATKEVFRIVFEDFGCCKTLTDNPTQSKLKAEHSQVLLQRMLKQVIHQQDETTLRTEGVAAPARLVTALDGDTGVDGLVLDGLCVPLKALPGEEGRCTLGIGEDTDLLARVKDVDLSVVWDERFKLELIICSALPVPSMDSRRATSLNDCCSPLLPTSVGGILAGETPRDGILRSFSCGPLPTPSDVAVLLGETPRDGIDEERDLLALSVTPSGTGLLLGETPRDGTDEETDLLTLSPRSTLLNMIFPDTLPPNMAGHRC
ncbi:Pentatricopeptide repeat-containing protein, mitochondrial [Ananas comosus]|uniref:Pentatricopeptide repeat-containing protein, mitochondrial n=1 Tax=Ananas comosus TaxID=4615 RepID=A0A199VYW3_ANACO|nr:Pentatricopeptide repeat-containing protein, mitochondrial [Ananas comosus]